MTHNKSPLDMPFFLFLSWACLTFTFCTPMSKKEKEKTAAEAYTARYFLRGLPNNATITSDFARFL